MLIVMDVAAQDAAGVLATTQMHVSRMIIV